MGGKAVENEENVCVSYSKKVLFLYVFVLQIF